MVVDGWLCLLLLLPLLVYSVVERAVFNEKRMTSVVLVVSVAGRDVDARIGIGLQGGRRGSVLVQCYAQYIWLAVEMQAQGLLREQVGRWVQVDGRVGGSMVLSATRRRRRVAARRVAEERSVEVVWWRFDRVCFSCSSSFCFCFSSFSSFSLLLYLTVIVEGDVLLLSLPLTVEWSPVQVSRSFTLIRAKGSAVQCSVPVCFCLCFSFAGGEKKNGLLEK